MTVGEAYFRIAVAEAQTIVAFERWRYPPHKLIRIYLEANSRY